jgi:hypothetical protein
MRRPYACSLGALPHMQKTKGAEDELRRPEPTQRGRPTALAVMLSD